MEISEQKPVGLTGRYINALFELCSEKNNLKKVVSDLESMQNLIYNNNDIKSLVSVLFVILTISPFGKLVLAFLNLIYLSITLLLESQLGLSIVFKLRISSVDAFDDVILNVQLNSGILIYN